MKVFGSNLIIGDEYYFDGNREEKGIYVGIFDNTLCFYPTEITQYPAVNEDGTVPFPIDDYEYEEV